jgi:hypothetical protein
MQKRVKNDSVYNWDNNFIVMNNIEYSRQGTPAYDTLEAEKEKYT